jgi:hypothetical protein
LATGMAVSLVKQRVFSWETPRVFASAIEKAISTVSAWEATTLAMSRGDRWHRESWVPCWGYSSWVI